MFKSIGRRRRQLRALNCSLLAPTPCSHGFSLAISSRTVSSNPALITSTALFVVISILCAWLCARFASRRAARHGALVLHYCEVMGFFNHSQLARAWPHWYWLSWLLTWPVSCWLGLLAARRPAD